MMRHLLGCALVLAAIGASAAPALATEPDVAAGLRWLAAQQERDGSWGTRDKLALTGMAGLALLASGSTPQRGPYAHEIRSAIRFVLGCQGTDQDPRGWAFAHPTSGYSAIHNHGYAPELYDLRTDPAETVNLCQADAPPPQAQALRDRLGRWMADTGDYISISD